MFAHVYSCLPMITIFTSVYPFFRVFTRFYLFATVYSC